MPRFPEFHLSGEKKKSLFEKKPTFRLFLVDELRRRPKVFWQKEVGSSSSLKYFFSLSRAVGKWRFVFRKTVDITQKHLGILVFVCLFSSPLEGRFSLSLSFIIIVIISERRTTNQQDVGNHKSLSAFSHIPRRMQISEAPSCFL